MGGRTRTAVGFGISQKSVEQNEARAGQRREEQAGSMVSVGLLVGAVVALSDFNSLILGITIMGQLRLGISQMRFAVNALIIRVTCERKLTNNRYYNFDGCPSSLK